MRLGWFASMPVGLVTAISVSGHRTDLVTIPPHVSEQAAAAAMRHATRPGNRDHAPAILAAADATTAAADATAGRAPGSIQRGDWEREGGQLPGGEAPAIPVGARRTRPAQATGSVTSR